MAERHFGNILLTLALEVVSMKRRLVKNVWISQNVRKLAESALTYICVLQ